jgi:hypothetical protein
VILLCKSIPVARQNSSIEWGEGDKCHSQELNLAVEVHLGIQIKDPTSYVEVKMSDYLYCSMSSKNSIFDFLKF